MQCNAGPPRLCRGDAASVGVLMKFAYKRERKILADKIESMRGRDWMPDELLELIARISQIQLKACAIMAAAPFALPEDDDLESLPLDMLAQQQGLARHTVSAWGF